MSLFILFEGVEGSGKSTQAKTLKRHLVKLGLPVVLVKEPGSTAVGNASRKLLKHRLDIRIDPVTELLLFSAARSQLIAEVIRPALAKDQIVICDRYAESTLAYQGYGRGLDLNTIRTINEISTGGLRPDLIILPDIDVEEGLSRKGTAATNDRFERETISFHHRVRKGYLEMAKKEPDRWFVVDSSQPKRRISKLIWQKVQSYLPLSW